MSVRRPPDLLPRNGDTTPVTAANPRYANQLTDAQGLLVSQRPPGPRPLNGAGRRVAPARFAGPFVVLASRSLSSLFAACIDRTPRRASAAAWRSQPQKLRQVGVLGSMRGHCTGSPMMLRSI